MDTVLRALIIFAILWVVIRLTGKREVAQLSAFDMILLVTVGDLVSQGVVQEDYSLTTAVVAVATFSGASILLAWLGFRFPRARPVIEGRARVAVRDGEPILDVLNAERLTIADLHEACREQGIKRLRDIELCVLETDGSFSFFTSGPDDDREGATEDHEIH